VACECADSSSTRRLRGTNSLDDTFQFVLPDDLLSSASSESEARQSFIRRLRGTKVDADTFNSRCNADITGVEASATLFSSAVSLCQRGTNSAESAENNEL